MKIRHHLVAGILAFTIAIPAPAIAIDFVTVGDPGNPNDTVIGSGGSGPFGAVSYTYAIGKYEVTNAQYAEFLNAVDLTAANPLSLYDPSMNTDVRGGIILNNGAAAGLKYEVKLNMGNKPVNYVNFFDAIRFTNWLHNGQGGASTETGAYTLLGGAAVPSNGTTVTRNVGASYWIPSENEWYKAAYYDPVSAGATADYWQYPTRSDILPFYALANTTGDISNPDANVANFNFNADWNGQNGNVTTVGSAGNGSASYYGTYDQAGNVHEWTETMREDPFRIIRGSSWLGDSSQMLAGARLGANPSNSGNSYGFRVASVVPEPSSAMLMFGSGLMFLLRRRRGSCP